MISYFLISIQFLIAQFSKSKDNNSSHYNLRNYNFVNLVNYLTEDIDNNEYYVYFRSNKSWLFNSSQSGVDNRYRGDQYLNGQRQIMSRYNLQRLVNGMGNMEHVRDYQRKIFPGYFPTMTYSISLSFSVGNFGTIK